MKVSGDFVGNTGYLKSTLETSGKNEQISANFR